MKMNLIAPALLLLALSTAVHADGGTISGQIFIVTNGQRAVKLPLVEVSAISDADYNRLLKAWTRDINLRRDKQAKELVSMKQELSTIEADSEFTKFNDISRERSEFLERCSRRERLGYAACVNTPEAREIKQRLDEQEQLVAPMRKRQREVGTAFSSMLEDYRSSASQNALFDIAESTLKVVGKSKTDPDGKFTIKKAIGGDVLLLAKAERQVFDKKESYRWLVKVPKGSSSIMLSNDNMLETGCSTCARIPAEIVSHQEVSAFF